VLPPPGPRKYWSRRALTSWLLERLSSGVPAIVGIDHAFSFPMAYFEKHGLPHDWPGLLNEFRSDCPTDEPNTYVDFVREGMAGSWSKGCSLDPEQKDRFCRCGPLLSQPGNWFSCPTD
jgi:hypothetical protein